MSVWVKYARIYPPPTSLARVPWAPWGFFSQQMGHLGMDKSYTLDMRQHILKVVWCPFGTFSIWCFSWAKVAGMSSGPRADLQAIQRLIKGSCLVCWIMSATCFSQKWLKLKVFELSNIDMYIVYWLYYNYSNILASYIANKEILGRWQFNSSSRGNPAGARYAHAPKAGAAELWASATCLFSEWFAKSRSVQSRGCEQWQDLVYTTQMLATCHFSQAMQCILATIQTTTRPPFLSTKAVDYE